MSQHSLYELKGSYFSGNYHPHTHRSARKWEKTCPADLNQLLWQARSASDLTDPCIQSAQKGFETWRKTSMEQRIQSLINYQKNLEARKDDIAHALALEVGKPLWEAKTEASALISKVTVTIQEALKRIETKTYESILPNIQGQVVFKPIGPSLIIGPFNFPCHLANGQITSALLAGNSIIFKPSEKTIYSAQLMFDCLNTAGFPDGVVNFLAGDAQDARILTQSKDIKAIYFTGSKAVGIKILEQTYSRLDTLVALELGGKNTTIIHQDCQLEHAMTETLRACYLTSGQRCTSTGIIAVQRSLITEFCEQFQALAKKILVDHPTKFKQQPFMGPVIDPAAEQAYLNYCNQATEQGATALINSEKLSIPNFTGHYLAPALHVIDKKPWQQCDFLKDEIFAPQATIVPYDDIDEAIAIANSTEYGLAAAVFTQSSEIYQHCLNDIDAGILNLNRSTVGASAKLPFGGLKSSGNFRPAGLNMIDHCVHQVATLQTTDDSSSKIQDIVGLKD